MKTKDKVMEDLWVNHYKLIRRMCRYSSSKHVATLNVLSELSGAGIKETKNGVRYNYNNVYPTVKSLYDIMWGKV